MKITVALLAFVLIHAQDTAQQDRVMKAVRAAVAPALPYPESDEAGAMPANNDAVALWMVQPLHPGDTAIEVTANPLNQQNQLAANRAMAQIDRNIAAAQRKAEAQYEHALAEVKRTGKSQDVDGVSLADEGVDGEKIDADSHVTIEVLFNRPDYRFAIRGRVEPGTGLPIPLNYLNVFAHTYKEDPRTGPEHYKEAERLVFLGTFGKPHVTQRVREAVYDILVTPASAQATIVVRMRGNQALVEDITAKTNWNQLLELLK